MQKIRKIVRRLRARPEHERKHLVNIFTFFGAIVMIVLWTFTLGSSFSDPDLKTQVKQEFQPFDQLKANVIDGYNVISDAPKTDTNSVQQ